MSQTTSPRLLRLPLHRAVQPLAAALLLVPGAALAQDAGDLRDFQLPPSGGATGTPQAQGPVDTAGGAPIRPRVIGREEPAPAPTAAPAPPRAQPSAAPARPPVLSQPETRPVPAPAPAARPAEGPTAARTRAVPAPAEAGPTSPAAIGAPAPLGTAIPEAAAQPAPATGIASPAGTGAAVTAGGAAAAVVDDSSSTPGWLVPLLLLGAGVGGWLLWRRRRATGDAVPPVIERPLAREPGAAPTGSAATAPALHIKVEPLKLTRSLMNTSLAYRLTVANRTTRTVGDVRIGAELTAAHGARPLEEQIATPASALPEAHRIDRLAPGQTRMLEGRIDLPVASIAPIRQGRAALFVPLLRLVAEGVGMEPLARTVVVGQSPAPGSLRLQPFRLDEPPRSYQPIAQRPLDEAALAL